MSLLQIKKQYMTHVPAALYYLKHIFLIGINSGIANVSHAYDLFLVSIIFDL